jgi:pimeloyl-ACP methyl ester carboxylesterase
MPVMRIVIAGVSVLLVLGVVAGRARPSHRTSQTAERQPIVRPFRIHIPDDTLRDLQERLGRTRLPDALDGSGWDYGTDLAYLKTLIEYWRSGFDWREQERRLNQLDHFTTDIDGVNVHFIHQRSKHADALPLVLTHGWPGSIVEFQKVIGPLTDPERFGGRAEDAFHVVAPSLPGFGFSGRPRERGYGPERMARVIQLLMTRLGYARYGLQGGDWGAIINRLVALRDAGRVAGLHLNFCTAGPPPGAADPHAGVPEAELRRYQARQAFMENERGYSQLQSTKPQTLGYGLTDSPAGLAAWIVEKFRAWCDCGGNVEKKFTRDELLTNITIYWATNTAASSARIYFENRVAGSIPGRVAVPTACALFPFEIAAPPRRWVEERYNLTRWTDMPRGGHFAALEEPELLVGDIRAFFSTLR